MKRVDVNSHVVLIEFDPNCLTLLEDTELASCDSVHQITLCASGTSDLDHFPERVCIDQLPNDQGMSRRLNSFLMEIQEDITFIDYQYDLIAWLCVVQPHAFGLLNADCTMP